MKIHTGDTVVIMTGKDKGKQGRVLRVLADKGRVVVEGLNMRVRHIRKTPQQAGQRIHFEASVHVSNVAILDPKTKKPTRIGYSIDAKTGAKKRVARASGEVIAKSAAVKAAKPIKKADAKIETPDVKDKKEHLASKDHNAPSKTPFWKRGAKSQGGVDGGTTSGADASPNVIQTAHRAQGG